MKKYVYLISVCACLALSAAASVSIQSPGAFEANPASDHELMDNQQHCRIATMAARNIEWNDEIGQAMLADAAHNLGWKTWLVPSEDNASLVAKNFFEGLDLPLVVDYDCGAVRLMAYDLIASQTAIEQQGVYTIDMNKWMYIVPAERLLSGVDECSAINGTIDSDGSIHLNGDFALIVYQVMTRKDSRGQVLDRDTTCRLSPILSGVSFMVPNGVHKYNVVTDRQSLEQMNDVLANMSENVNEDTAPSLKKFVVVEGFGNECEPLGHGGRIHNPIDPRNGGQASRGTVRGDGSSPGDQPALTSIIHQAELVHVDLPCEPLGHGGRIHKPIDPPGSGKGTVAPRENEPSLNSIIHLEFVHFDFPCEPLGHGGRIHNPIDPPGSGKGTVPPRENQPSLNSKIHVELVHFDPPCEPLGHGGRIHNPIDPPGGGKGSVAPRENQPSLTSSIHIQFLKDTVLVVTDDEEYEPSGHGGRIHNPIDPRPIGRFVSSLTAGSVVSLDDKDPSAGRDHVILSNNAQPGIETLEEPVYIFRNPDDNTITVYNLFGMGYAMTCKEVQENRKESIAAVTELIDHLLAAGNDDANLINDDVNGDGKLSIADVTALIDILINGKGE